MFCHNRDQSYANPPFQKLAQTLEKWGTLATGFANFCPFPIGSVPLCLFFDKARVENVHFYLSNVRIVRLDGTLQKYKLIANPNKKNTKDFQVDVKVHKK